jgi:hypothetical protein
MQRLQRAEFTCGAVRMMKWQSGHRGDSMNFLEARYFLPTSMSITKT